MPDAKNIGLNYPITELRGIGNERAALLNKLAVNTIADLLLLRPRRYEDRTKLIKISDLKSDGSFLVRGKVVTKGINYYKWRTKSVFEMIVEDETGRLHCRWWNQPYRDQMFKIGQELWIYGKVISERPKTMDNPETEIVEENDEESSVHTRRIAPIYPLTEGISQRWLRLLVWNTFNQFESLIQETNAEILRLAKEYCNLTLLPKREAIRYLHFPETLAQVEQSIKRFAFEEFFDLQLKLQIRRQNLLKNARGIVCSGDNSLIKPFLSKLGFKLTQSQTLVLREIRRDFSSGIPMRRLLQGDVGSGKTVVAACASLMAIESGYDVAIMAPTEILAQQHYKTFLNWLEPLGIKVFILTGSVKNFNPDEQDNLQLHDNHKNYGSLIVGTHSLIESNFSAKKLGLVIIDEQHKFGVAQRETLVKKGDYPHLLVMTATPIPRTLGLTIYGELDISILNEMPPGRGKIKTFLYDEAKLRQAFDFVKTQLQQGRQAYFVYPRLEDSDPVAGIKAVMQEYSKIKSIFDQYNVRIVHGRLNQQERELVMEEFRRNKINILVATSVIEVGIDIPNATVMVIMNAEQFGLAQLHQLRGRIGRGICESYCILVAKLKTASAIQRLKILEETCDGFRIAEADLQIRGPGEFLGKEQSGIPNFKFGNILTDLSLMQAAKIVATKIATEKQTV